MYIELCILYARTRTDVKKISPSCLEASWTRISPDQKFRKHFNFRSIVRRLTRYPCVFNKSLWNAGVFPSINIRIQTFSIFPSLRAHPQTLHPRGSRCAWNVTSADNAIHAASHLHQKIDQSLPLRISRNLNELRIHRKRTTPTTNTFLPNLPQLPATCPPRGEEIGEGGGSGPRGEFIP